MESRVSSFPKLKKELDSWRAYSNQLYNEDKALFRDLTARIWPSYAEAIEKSGRGYITEALLVSFIISHQKTLNWIVSKIKTRTSVDQEAL